MSSPAAVVGSSSLARVIRPESRFRPYREEKVEERSRLLSKMDAVYREARRRLPAEAMLDAGVCVGLLDPVSNVMANALLHRPEAWSGPNPSREVDDETELREEMAKRSLDGLLAFLVYFFPYLAGWEALRYLLVADADLLVAARLVVAHRGMMRFSVTSPASVQAFRGALLLAAQVAKHPEPERLVGVWMSLSSQLQQCLGFLSEMNNQTLEEINIVPIKMLLDCPPDLGNAWDLAVSRPPYSSSIADMPYQATATRSMRMALLDTIRCFYLQALARLPRHELRTRYRRSLLRGGYCYGPLDPVSNIIVNTIWHDVMLPAAEQTVSVLDTIGPNSLTRLESRSFYGLASFLQTRYHSLSEHEVVQCLVASCGYLPCADRNLDADHMSVANINLNDAAAPGGEAEWQREQCRSRCPGICDAVRKLEQQSPCTSTREAYEAAATAAWHRDPEAQAVFLSSCKTMLQGPALSLLQSGDRLTSEDAHYIASLFSPKQKPAPERIEKPNDDLMVDKIRSEAWQRRVSRKVEAALCKHLLQDGEPMYELHIICSANVSVCGPVYGEDKNDPLSPSPCKFRYSHVNFWATQKGSPSADRYPILFFAEFDNEEDEGEPLLCCPVDVPTPFAEHVRCVYCEAQGVKIVHPVSEKLNGGGREFDDVICQRRYLNNDLLICQNEHAVQRMGAVGEDFMYIADFK